MGGMPLYSVTGQLFGYFSRWYGLLDITANEACRLDPSLRPPDNQLYWYKLRFGDLAIGNLTHAYTALSTAKQNLQSLQLQGDHTDGKTLFNEIHHNTAAVASGTWSNGARRLKLRYGDLSDDMMEDIVVPLHEQTVKWVAAVLAFYKHHHPDTDDFAFPPLASL
ncbi:hypothetical protein WJX77_012472 [Trebouxia sp. C0004]